MMKFSIHSKLPDVSTTIFTIMSKMAQEHNALNLSQGFPGFESDKELIDLVSKAMNEGYNQYAPMAGHFALRERVCEKINTLYGKQYNPETEITITAGATQAIFTIISTFVSKGDEVIIFEPAYDCYEPAIVLNGGKSINIPLNLPDFSIDWESVKEKFSSKTKMIIINTPHNPGGSILSKNDLLKLQDLVKGSNCIVLSDEVYEHIIFDGATHQSAARFSELASRSFITASFGKTFHNTGWKVGYCVAPEPLMKEFQKVHQFNVFSVNHPIQEALATYLEEKTHYLSLSLFFQKKRDLFLKGLEGSHWQFTPAKGTYFQLLSFKNITDEKDTDFAKRLTIDHKVASIPISVFFKNQTDPKMLRFCFAKTDEVIEKATDILRKL